MKNAAPGRHFSWRIGQAIQPLNPEKIMKID
jgi:hypothetical protein